MAVCEACKLPIKCVNDTCIRDCILPRSGETVTDPPFGLAVPSQSPEVASASLKSNHCGE